jgi:hypothetical protein
MFSMIMGEAPILLGGPACVFPARSRHCATENDGGGSGVDPHIGFMQAKLVGVLSHKIWA